MKKFSLVVLLLLSMCAFIETHAQFYNGTQMEFGKNRIQYRDFNWLYYPYENLEVYHYQGGEDLAKYTVQSADRSLKEIEKFLDTSIEDNIQIICYNKQSEFRQSNIGLSNGGEYNIGGATEIIGSKIFVYYQTDHHTLDQQIKSNMSRLIFRMMMYGDEWKEVWKSSSTLSIPEWYENGIVSYMSEPWNSEIESRVKADFNAGIYDNFNVLTGDDSKYAGHSLWKYLSDVYGDAVIPNVLYMTKISRNIESGFLLVLGVSLESLMRDYQSYYKNYFSRNTQGALPKSDPLFTGKEILSFQGAKGAKKEARITEKILGELPVKSKEKYVYSQFKISPDGNKIAYVTNELGQYKVWLYDVNSGKHKRIFKKEYKLARITDKTFPILAWHPTSEVLTFTFEDRGMAFLGSYYFETKKVEKKELFRIDKVIDLSYSDNGRQIIFSGVKEGKTDLFLYQVIGNYQQQLTDDIYDDMNARFIRNSSAVIFASNRPDDTLRTKVPITLFNTNKDIYIYDLEKGKSQILERITDTPMADESHPFDYNDGFNYTFLSDAKGYVNRYTAYQDSAISRIDTVIHYDYFTVSQPVSNFSLNPIEYDYNPKTGNYSLVFYEDGKFNFYQENREKDEVALQLNFEENKSNGNLTTKIEDKEILKITEKQNPGEVDIDNYVFDNEVEEVREENRKNSNLITDLPEETNGKGTEELPLYDLPSSRNYRLNFATDEVTTQIGNTFNNQFYQNRTGPNSLYPGLSGMFQVSMSDLFENYRLIGGIRLSGNLQNTDLAVNYQNLKKRIDKKITLQRQSQRIFTLSSILKLQTYSFNGELSKPINELMAIKASLMLRNDRLIFLSTDPLNLAEPNQQFTTTGLKLEWVYDNTINRGLNLLNGTRFKVWGEFYQDLRYNVFDPEAPDNSTMLIFEDESDFKVVGFDFRHYEPLHRNMILALRVAGSTSFGSNRLLHYLGGVDNWLFQKVNSDQDNPFDPDQNFVYQSMATPLRGFFLNSRNGNSMALANAEVRWPIIKYFMKKPVKSDFIENFQLVSFYDIGSAWTGSNPFSDDNFFNSQTDFDNFPVTVTIQNNRDPIIQGFGFGLRSRLLGYFVRADWAWGVDDGIVMDRVFSISLSLDF